MGGLLLYDGHMKDITVKECDTCRQVILITRGFTGREVARDLPSREIHDCFDVPENAQLLVMEEEDTPADAFHARYVDHRTGRNAPCGGCPDPEGD